MPVLASCLAQMGTMIWDLLKGFGQLFGVAASALGELRLASAAAAELGHYLLKSTGRLSTSTSASGRRAPSGLLLRDADDGDHLRVSVRTFDMPPGPRPPAIWWTTRRISPTMAALTSSCSTFDSC